MHSSAAALAIITDATVVTGMGIGYRMGRGFLGTLTSVVERMAYHGIQARYVFGAPAHATMAKTGRSAASVALGAGIYVGTTASSGGSLSLDGFAKNFIPVVNSVNALTQMPKVCAQ